MLKNELISAAEGITQPFGYYPHTLCLLIIWQRTLQTYQISNHVWRDSKWWHVTHLG